MSCAHSNTSCDEGNYMESNQQPGIVDLNVIYRNQVNATFQEQYCVCGGTTYGLGNPHHYTLSEYTPKVFVGVRS